MRGSDAERGPSPSPAGTAGRRISALLAQPELSVVIPSLDEGSSISQTVASVSAALDGRDFEIIVVDDGSRDGSCDGLADGVTRVVTNPRPLGYGHAIKEGVRAARAPLVAIMDADGTYRAEDLVSLVDAAEGFEMVVGERSGGGARAPFVRNSVKWVLFRFAEYMAGTRIPDLNSGLRVFRRDVFLRHEALLPHGFSLTSTLTIAILSDGRPIRYLPIRYLEREGESKIQPLRDTARFFGLVVRTACLFRPLKVFVPIGLVLLAAALARLAYDVLVLENIGDSSTLLVTAGLQVALMGLVAELVVRRR